jgi:hypothetical protein
MVEYEKDMNEFLPRYNRIVDTLVAAANSLPVQDVVLTADDGMPCVINLSYLSIII